jgi:hypothetical protein
MTGGRLWERVPEVRRSLAEAERLGQDAGRPVVELADLAAALAAGGVGDNGLELRLEAAADRLSAASSTGRGPATWRSAAPLGDTFRAVPTGELRVSAEVAGILDAVDAPGENLRAHGLELLASRIIDLAPAAPAPAPSDGRPPSAAAAPRPSKAVVPPTEWLRFGVDLTRRAADGAFDEVVGREEETHRLTRVLLRRSKPNPLLIGPPGVGKTALVEGLAKRIATGTVPKRMADWRVVSISLSALLGGTSYRGEFEERLDRILTALAGSRPPHVLFIDEFHLVVVAGSARGGVDAGSILKPYLARGDLLMIGACTEEDFHLHVRHDGALARRMSPIYVAEPTRDEAFAILLGHRPVLERFHGVTIGDDALEAALDAARGAGRVLPDGALEALDDACAEVVLTRPRGRAVTAADIAAVEGDRYHQGFEFSRGS